MPKSKSRKNHKSKVAARNTAVKNESARVQKAQKEFIMNLIKQEQEKGLFDNVQPGPMSGPMIGGGPLSFDGDLLTFDGPTFDGPIVDNVVIDVPIVDDAAPQSETEETTEEVKENN
jgi:hypothetical protein